MINIAVCDDESIFAKELGEMVQLYYAEKDKECRVSLFNSGEKLLKTKTSFQLLLLDLDMPGMDGVELGSKIKLLYPECTIIVASSRADWFKKTYQFGAFRFVSKPYDKDEVYEALDAFLHIQKECKMIELYYQRSPFMVDMSEIKYIMAINGDSEFFVGGGFYRREGSLSEIEKILDEREFFRINRQYIVNLKWVKICHHNFIMIDDMKFTVSRDRKKDFLNAYCNYDLYYRKKES